MLSIITSMALHGLDGYAVSVQVDVSSGMPSFEIVGLPDVSVKESKERVKTAIKNSGVEFFSRRVIVNLAPANTKKEGPIFDLPIAIGILIAMETVSRENAEKKLEDIDSQFAKLTHLDTTDIAMLMLATALQIGRFKCCVVIC